MKINSVRSLSSRRPFGVSCKTVPSFETIRKPLKSISTLELVQRTDPRDQICVEPRDRLGRQSLPFGRKRSLLPIDQKPPPSGPRTFTLPPESGPNSAILLNILHRKGRLLAPPGQGRPHLPARRPRDQGNPPSAP